eukprot:4139323-Amphidinium_carterae.3
MIVMLVIRIGESQSELFLAELAAILYVVVCVRRLLCPDKPCTSTRPAHPGFDQREPSLEGHDLSARDTPQIAGSFKKTTS